MNEYSKDEIEAISAEETLADDLKKIIRYVSSSVSNGSDASLDRLVERAMWVHGIGGSETYELALSTIVAAGADNYDRHECVTVVLSALEMASAIVDSTLECGGYADLI